MKPKISVIICTYNRCDTLRELLDCFLIQDIKEPFEVVVVDNNSQDGTKGVVKSFEPKFHGKLRYFFESRQGKPFALNLGIQEAKGGIIVFTDDDCLVEKDYLTNIYEVFDKYGDEIGVVGGRIVPRWVNGDRPGWFVEIEPDDWWHRNFFNGALGVLDYGDKPFVVDFTKGVYKGNLFYGANISIRRELLDRYGFFDPEKILTQDTEICLRLFRAGVKGLYVPEIIVRHRINALKITPQYYYRWHFLRGTLFEVQEKYQKRIHYPFGIRWGFIAQTVRLWIDSIFTSSLGNKVYLRSHVHFNLGQMVQIAKKQDIKLIS
jgi:GT2 family glycosyltransferase